MAEARLELRLDASELIRRIDELPDELPDELLDRLADRLADRVGAELGRRSRAEVRQR